MKTQPIIAGILITVGITLILISTVGWNADGVVIAMIGSMLVGVGIMVATQHVHPGH